MLPLLLATASNSVLFMLVAPQSEAQTGSVMLIQRFGSALNLNVHAHMLFLDGVYVNGKNGQLRFHRTAAPDIKALEVLLHRISHRVARCLERQGYLERDEENIYTVLDDFFFTRSTYSLQEVHILLSHALLL